MHLTVTKNQLSESIQHIWWKRELSIIRVLFASEMSMCLKWTGGCFPKDFHLSLAKTQFTEKSFFFVIYFVGHLKSLTSLQKIKKKLNQNASIDSSSKKLNQNRYMLQSSKERTKLVSTTFHVRM